MLSMAGVDHECADVALREAYAFTMDERADVYAFLRARGGVAEAALICTCHRTELWIVGDVNAKALLLAIKRMPSGHIVSREGDAAALHLHRLACGLCSKIIGDEQIISQIQDALRLSPLAGPVLRQLFRFAVSAGKSARAQTGAVRLHRGVAYSALDAAEAALGSLRGKQALIIGSGEMGMLCAAELQKRGCAAIMTLRRRHKLPSVLPQGVEFIEYDARYDCLRAVDAVIGATSSPHYVLTLERAREAVTKPVVMVDIAMPRDIDPQIGSLDFVTLLNVDELRDKAFPQASLDIMERVAADETRRFLDWLKARETLPDVHAIVSFGVEQMSGIEGLTSEQQQAVLERTRLMLDRLLFAAKAQGGVDEFSAISKALARAAGRKSLQ